MSEKITQLVVGPIATNCWIYKTYEETADGKSIAAVIDPGGEPDAIKSALKKLDLVPGYILLTHGHFDHIAALPSLAASFPDAQIAIHRLDGEYLGPCAYAAHSASIKAATGDSSFVDSFLPGDGNGIPPATRDLEDGDVIGPFTVMNLPGHTPGSAAFWDKKAGILFTGDTLFKSGYGRTDLPGGSETGLLKSLKRLFSMDAGINVYPGHGGVTTIGREAG